MTKKYTAKDIATILFAVTRDTDASNLAPLIETFVAKIGASRLKRMLPEIISEYQTLDDKANNRVEAKVLFKERPEKSVLEQVKTFVQIATGTKDVTLTDNIDARLLGGFKLYVGDIVYDASLRGRLNRLAKHIA